MALEIVSYEIIAASIPTTKGEPLKHAVAATLSDKSVQVVGVIPQRLDPDWPITSVNQMIGWLQIWLEDGAVKAEMIVDNWHIWRG